MTLFHFVIVTLVIWLLEALHAIPSWIPGGALTVMIVSFIIIAMGNIYQKTDEDKFRAQVLKEAWR
jgi:hypothetical protein